MLTMESRVMGNCRTVWSGGKSGGTGMQPAAAYPAQKITYRYPSRW